MAQSAFPLRPAIYLPLSALRGDESQGKGCYPTFNPPHRILQHKDVYTLIQYWSERSAQILYLQVEVVEVQQCKNTPAFKYLFVNNC